MARQDHKVTPGRLRNTAAAVIAAVFILVFLVPDEAFTGYRIDIEGNEVDTDCYWVQNSKIFLCQGTNPIPLSRIRSIKEGTFTELEKEMHQDAKRRFFLFLTWMMDRDAALKEKNLANLDILEQIEDMRASAGKPETIDTLKKKCLEEIEPLKKETSALQKLWLYVRIPERSWVIFGEIKSAQLLTGMMSLEARRIYLTTGDPTYLAYTFEHMEQVISFDPSFSRSIRKFFGKRNSE
jgi:hypothetical protein